MFVFVFCATCNAVRRPFRMFVCRVRHMIAPVWLCRVLTLCCCTVFVFFFFSSLCCHMHPQLAVVFRRILPATYSFLSEPVCFFFLSPYHSASRPPTNHFRPKPSQPRPGTFFCPLVRRARIQWSLTSSCRVCIVLGNSGARTGPV